MDIEAVAGWLSTSTRHIRRLVAEKRIPFVKVGHFVRFDPDDIVRWIQEQKVQVGDGAASRELPWVRHPTDSVDEETLAPRRDNSRRAPPCKNNDPPWLSSRKG